MDELKQAMAAIAKKCRDCSGGSVAEVQACPVEGCPLYRFRQGQIEPKQKHNGKAK